MMCSGRAPSGHLKGLQRCVCVCSRVVGGWGGGTSATWSPLWAGHKVTWASKSNQRGGREGRSQQPAVGYSRRSEVGRDGLQGVFRCTVDVHILKRGRHECQRTSEQILHTSPEDKRSLQLWFISTHHTVRMFSLCWLHLFFLSRCYGFKESQTVSWWGTHWWFDLCQTKFIGCR